jgi:Peptidase family M28
VAKQKGAAFVFIVDPKFGDNVRARRRQINTQSWQLINNDSTKAPKGLINFMYITPQMADALFGKKLEKVKAAHSAISAGKPAKPIRCKTDVLINMDKRVEDLHGSNVLGFIEGSDPQLKKEYVFITAHYDHLGVDKDKIYYGADDNASGTAGVIEIARAFAEAKRKGLGPKRSVVCMLVSGEEKGLLGSSFYVEFPIFSLQQTIVDINTDMIGRVDEAHRNDSNYIYVIGADRMSADLHAVNEASNNAFTKLTLDYKYNSDNDPNRYYERSDHYNFVEKGIPAVFYFNGTHADYHKPTDTPDKLHYGLMAKRAQLAFYTAWELAHRYKRLMPDKKKKQ